MGNILSVSGYPLAFIWGLGVALGVHFGGQGVPLDAFGAQAVPRTALLSYARSILGDFGAQREAKRAPQCNQNRSKINSKIDRKIDWIFDRFRKRFLYTLGMSLRRWTLENELLVWARCYFSEIHVFHARFGLELIFD